MKLDKIVIANTLALTTTVLWVVCTVIVWLLPYFSLSVLKWWLHGLDISVMGGWNLTFADFVLGGATLVLSAWVAGYVFGWCWEKMSEK